MGFHLKVFVPALSCLFNGEFTCSLHKSQNLQVYSSFYLTHFAPVSLDTITYLVKETLLLNDCLSSCETCFPLGHLAAVCCETPNYITRIPNKL